jgi:hypothetical protein
MPFHRAVAEQIDPEAAPTPVDAVDVVVPPAEIELAELRMMNAALIARVAELEAPPEEHWLPLKAAAVDCAMVYETLRAACADGAVQARREGQKHWFVNVANVKARQRRLGQRK